MYHIDDIFKGLFLILFTFNNTIIKDFAEIYFSYVQKVFFMNQTHLMISSQFSHHPFKDQSMKRQYRKPIQPSPQSFWSKNCLLPEFALI